MAARLFKHGIFGSSRILAISAFSAGLWRGRSPARHLCLSFMFGVPAGAKSSAMKSLRCVRPPGCHKEGADRDRDSNTTPPPAGEAPPIRGQSAQRSGAVVIGKNRILIYGPKSDGTCEWSAKKRPRGERGFLTASAQSTTSSALINIASGIVRPSISNVFLLIARRKRDGCSNGRSAGCAPLKIRSARPAARS